MFRFFVFCFFAVSIYASSNNYVPSGTVMDNAKLVTQEGWKAANKDLIKHIEANQESFLKNFLIVDNKPFSLDEYYSKKEGVSFLTYFDENYYALAISKYLESKGNIVKSIYIYHYILSNMNHAYFNFPSGLGFVYRQVVEDMTVKSFIQSLDSNKYSKKEKIVLKEILQNHLIHKLELLYMAWAIDQRVVSTHFYTSLRDKNSAFMSEEALDYDIFYRSVHQNILVGHLELYMQLAKISDKRECEVLTKDVNNKRKNAEKLFLNSEGSGLDDDYFNASVDYLVYTSLPINMCEQKFRLLERIELNRKLSERIK